MVASVQQGGYALRAMWSMAASITHGQRRGILHTVPAQSALGVGLRLDDERKSCACWMCRSLGHMHQGFRPLSPPKLMYSFVRLTGRRMTGTARLLSHRRGGSQGRRRACEAGFAPATARDGLHPHSIGCPAPTRGNAGDSSGPGSPEPSSRVAAVSTADDAVA